MTDVLLKRVTTLRSKQNRLTSSRQSTATRHDRRNRTDCKEFERRLLDVLRNLKENSDVRQTISEAKPGRAGLVLGWVTISKQYTILTGFPAAVELWAFCLYAKAVYETGKRTQP